MGSDPGEPRAPEAGQWFDYQIKQPPGRVSAYHLFFVRGISSISARGMC